MLPTTSNDLLVWEPLALTEFVFFFSHFMPPSKSYITLCSHLINYFMVNCKTTLHEKCPYSEFSGRYFPAFGLNTDQKNSEYGHFSRSANHLVILDIINLIYYITINFTYLSIYI